MEWDCSWESFLVLIGIADAVAFEVAVGLSMEEEGEDTWAGEAMEEGKM